jgi:hypothetical protein
VKNLEILKFIILKKSKLRNMIDREIFLKREKEKFLPVKDERVLLHICGPWLS